MDMIGSREDHSGPSICQFICSIMTVGASMDIDKSSLLRQLTSNQYSSNSNYSSTLTIICRMLAYHASLPTLRSVNQSSLAHSTKKLGGLLFFLSSCRFAGWQRRGDFFARSDLLLPERRGKTTHCQRRQHNCE